MRSKRRVTPSLKLSETEQALHNAFIAEYLTDYPDLTDSDKRQLEVAATQYILYLRLAADELEHNRHHLNLRYSYIGQMRAVLNDLGLSRKTRRQGMKDGESSAEAELRELLLSLSADQK